MCIIHWLIRDGWQMASRETEGGVLEVRRRLTEGAGWEVQRWASGQQTDGWKWVKLQELAKNKPKLLTKYL